MELKDSREIKFKDFSISNTPVKNFNSRFNNTIDTTNIVKTPKNLNLNLRHLSFSSHKNLRINKTINNNNIESMNKILGKLTNLNSKLDKLKIRRKKNLKLFNVNKSKPKIMCKTETKNKYLLLMNDYYKNKLLLKKRKLNNIITDEERNDAYNRFLNPNFLNFDKTEINNKEPSRRTNLAKIIANDDDNETKNEENNFSSKLRNHEDSKISNNLEIEKKLCQKNSFNSEDLAIPKIIPKNKEKSKNEQNTQSNNNDLSNSFIIYQDHINYIKRIRENEILDLIDRYKKSIEKNKLEEMTHIQRFVFPQELINYLIKMKKELIVDKFRTEYFNKLDRYNLNNILHLKNSKNKNTASRKFN
jgi:hypothetical protein